MMAHEYSIVAAAVGNVLLLRATLFPLLERDALAMDMSHMDPSDIIATPFPLQKLCTYVALSLGWNLAVALICRMIMNNNSIQQPHHNHQQRGVLQIIYMIMLSTISIHFIFILCGIHPTMCPLHTLVSAFYVAFNMLLPVITFDPTNANTTQLGMKEVTKYLFGPLPVKKEQQSSSSQKLHSQHERIQLQCIHQYTALGTIVGMAACAILRVLDHGMQIQRYPIPIIVGATWGCCGGSILGIVLTRVSGIGPSR